MSLSPIWRNRLATIGASALALWFGAGLAQQDYFWPLLIAGFLGMLVLTKLLRLPIDVILLGMILFGYIAGNRGFAQISLVGFFPLLPAEFVLLIAGTLLVVHSAFRRDLPVRTDALNFTILAWIGICGVRLIFDLRLHGFYALRDFATVYYALFFFIAQNLAGPPHHRRWLYGCLLTGCFAMLVLYPMVDNFPDFFYGILTIRSNPVIMYKADLVGTLLVAGAVLTYHRYEISRPNLATWGSLCMIGCALTTNNRASLLALASIIGLLILGRRWRFSIIQGFAGVTAVVAILFFAYVTNTSWQETPLHGAYERAVSITDLAGERRYTGDETYFKGDNNRFRMIWWHAVIMETVEGNPWFGLGFGTDLASRFVSEYYPEQGEEFDARSPHNVMLTLFGRAGIAGTIPLLIITALLALNIIRCARRHDLALGAWCAAWIILVSACFGVVLEGPMGAVVFWSLLGIAAAETQHRSQNDEIDPAEPESLPNPDASA
jgi:hypothetical protein